MIKKLKKQVIISVQASFGEPLYEEQVMNALIETVVSLGGAKALRLAGERDIINTRKKFPEISIIGITKPKKLSENWLDEVYITPTLKDAESIINAGADVIAFDATLRKRDVSVKEMTDYIHSKGKLAMADIATFEDAQNAQSCGIDIISTTLAGYTKETKNNNLSPDFELLELITKKLNTPAILEGRIWHPQEVKKAFDLGAYSVVIGSAITRPQHIVKKFLNYNGEN